MNFIDKVKGFLFEPTNTLHNSREDSIIEALKYYFILFLIYSVLETFVRIFFGEMIISLMGKYAMISSNTEVKEIVIKFIYDVIYAIPAIIMGGAFLHIFVFIAGGKKGSNHTLKALVYSSTPSLLFGWIPIIGVIAGMWSLVLNIIGIRDLQEISTERAVFAVIVPFILLILLVAFLTGTIILPGMRIPLS